MKKIILLMLMLSPYTNTEEYSSSVVELECESKNQFRIYDFENDVFYSRGKQGGTRMQNDYDIQIPRSINNNSEPYLKYCTNMTCTLATPNGDVYESYKMKKKCSWGDQKDLKAIFAKRVEKAVSVIPVFKERNQLINNTGTD
tara:strand:+ start:210 stop:638 length:429 start_codon:yes stop_codon:yes gene_type:complete